MTDPVKPKSVILNIKFACKCGGIMTVSNRATRDNHQFGSNVFFFYCSKCGHQGRATHSKETIYPRNVKPKEYTA